MNIEIPEFKTLHTKIPIELFKELKNRHLFSEIDSIVSRLLIEYINDLEK